MPSALLSSLKAPAQHVSLAAAAELPAWLAAAQLVGTASCAGLRSSMAMWRRLASALAAAGRVGICCRLAEI